MFRFTIRDVLCLTVIVALAVGWGRAATNFAERRRAQRAAEHARYAAEIARARELATAAQMQAITASPSLADGLAGRLFLARVQCGNERRPFSTACQFNRLCNPHRLAGLLCNRLLRPWHRCDCIPGTAPIPGPRLSLSVAGKL